MKRFLLAFLSVLLTSICSATDLQGITATFPPIPLNGIGLLELRGDSGVPLTVTTNNTTITSGDTNVVKIWDGIVSGVGLGTTALTVVYTDGTNSFTNTCDVIVRPPSFTDDFSTSHDYLNAGVAGTTFDGIYDVSGAYPIPGSSYVPPAGSATLVADANITSNHNLTITANGDGWEGTKSGGFFLFKYVPGDFQMAVHLNGYTKAAFNMPGLLARAYAATNGILGQPFGYETPGASGSNNTSEYWISLVRFDYLGIGTYARRNLDGNVVQNTQLDQNDTNNWLLIVRSAGTNFSFYKKMNPTDPWRYLPNRTIYHVAQFAGRPMQVGIAADPWNFAPSPPNSASFDAFMLDLGTSQLGLRIRSNGSGSAIVSWSPDPNSSLESSSSLSSPDWQTIDGTPTLGIDGRYSLTLPIFQDAQYFRLRN